jgi:hypothetical protein
MIKDKGLKPIVLFKKIRGILPLSSCQVVYL